MAKKITLKEIGEMLARITKHMATKDDIADLRQELKGDVARVQEQVNSIEAHKLRPGDPLYGLKPTTRLRAR